MFPIRFTPEAIDDLRAYSRRDRGTITDKVKSLLKYEPVREARNNKKLRPNQLAERTESRSLPGLLRRGRNRSAGEG